MNIIHKRQLSIISASVTLLLIPFIASQFSSEVNWTTFDFGVAACLLLGVGLTIDFAVRKSKNLKSRIALVSLVCLLFLLLWLELAVGVFGTPIAGT